MRSKERSGQRVTKLCGRAFDQLQVAVLGVTGASIHPTSTLSPAWYRSISVERLVLDRDGGVAERDDDVTGLDAGVGGGAVLGHVDDPGAP